MLIDVTAFSRSTRLLARAIPLLGALAVSAGGCGGPINDPIDDPSDDPIVGGGCEYSSNPGKAKIVSVEAVTSPVSDCANAPTKVVFDFVPDDPSKASLAKKGIELLISSGEHPPKSWVDSSGLVVGSEHAAVFEQETAGTCTPQIFKLTDVDEQKAIEACFK